MRTNQAHEAEAGKAAADKRARKRLQYFEEHSREIVETIRQLVEVESPSDNKQAVDRLGQFLAGKFSAMGGKVRFHPAAHVGDHLQVDFGAETATALEPVLLLGHLDTVYPEGTLAAMPCRAAEDRLFGPGSLDMKSGIGLMLHSIARLQAESGLPRAVTVLLVSDEEIGSHSSRAITEDLAKKSAAVLVLEPAYGLKGAVKTARKGVGTYSLKVTGVAAHSGLDFEKGQSAILEIARQIERIAGFTDLKRGVTLNVGLVEGGTRVNVIPAEATAAIDVRIARMKDAGGMDGKLRSLKPFNSKCKLEISGGINRPPMERTAGVAALYAKAVAIAGQLGLRLEEAAVGGGSDGNFTAGIGIPTLDGLGGVGEGAHAAHESILISELARRAAVLTGLIATV